MIRLQGLHKFFNKGRQNEIHVINDVSLDLPDHGMVAIFGKSGCGKTTLLNVIGGLDSFSEGTITVNNQSIRENTDVIRNKYIGYIFQNYNLNKAESCFDNVADALRLCGMRDEDEIEERVTAALKNVNMEKYSRRTPDTLSGGQQQRIAIARAIVKNPRIILADEPTGNLDEANTMMIMDLLKAISQEHLVLLVTHEANLVDYYCDTVIELQDGKVVDTKQNKIANGITARDKNDIYLGELSHREIVDENATIEYYGEKPDIPIRLKIVNNGGKIYLQLGSGRVQFLDEFSEIKLHEGVYEEKKRREDNAKTIDMSKLPPVEGSAFGRLFSLKMSLKSGYTSNFKNSKKGKKVFRRCMSLFAAVVVFMSAIFGSAIGEIENAQKAYNHNVFYVYTPDATVSAKLNQAVGRDDTGVDFIRLTNDYGRGDENVSFRTATFETFAQGEYISTLSTNAVFLGASLAEGLGVVAGKGTDISDNEILITTKVADALLEKSTFGYLSDYRDLIGLVCSRVMIDGNYPRVAGIVASEESSIYLTERAMAKYVGVGSMVQLGSDYGIQIQDGEAIVIIYQRHEGVKIPTVNQTVRVRGKDTKIVGVKLFYSDYGEWLENNGYRKSDLFSYFSNVVENERLELEMGTPEFIEAVDQAVKDRYFEYFDYYYTEFDAFLRDFYFFDSSMIELWLYFEKGIEEAKFRFASTDYYYAQAYKAQYGKYPTQDDLSRLYGELPSLDVLLSRYINTYEAEFYKFNHVYGGQNAYLISDADYIACTKQLGETDSLTSYEDNYYDKPVTTDGDAIIASVDMAEMVYLDTKVSYGPAYYTVIHSNDPEKTAAWLTAEFSDLPGPDNYLSPFLTPDMLFDNIIEDQLGDIAKNLTAMLVVLVLMSVCMYFMMRSSLMNRIKEVGIYRAIGVSKKNLIFKFFVESAVLTAMTVLVGYLLSGAFIYICFGMSSLVESIFYYPLWLAGVDLLILCGVSLLFGTLPIMGLLRRTPSEILAKYDI